MHRFYIDFSADENQLHHNAFGILHSINNTQPVDSLVKPLKISLSRQQFMDYYQRTKKLGGQYMFVSSDDFIHTIEYDLNAVNAVWPGDDDMYDMIDPHLEKSVHTATKAGYDDIIWDIWNEPDIWEFWQRPWEQYLKVYLHCFRKIRALDPNAIIAGPSLGNYNEEKMESFLIFAKENEALPEILTWHDIWQNPRTIEDRMENACNLMAKHSVDINRIMLPEYANRNYQFSPGNAAIYIANIERVGVETAAKSCWKEVPPYEDIYNCFNASLDGLLDHETGKPRSIWWVYKKYEEMTGRSVSCSTRDMSLPMDGIAVFNKKQKKATILLGSSEQVDSTGTRDIEMMVSSIPDLLIRKGKIVVKIEKIPDSSGAPLDSPLLISEKEYKVNEGRISFKLPELGAEDSFFIELSNKKLTTNHIR